MNTHKHQVIVKIIMLTDERLSKTVNQVKEAIDRQFEGDNRITVEVIDCDCL